MSFHSPGSPSSDLAHPKYRPDIDGLRAIAVLSVVGFHAFPGLVRGGFVGVDVFFVISGFLISAIIFGSLELKKFSLLEFYQRRIRRIFPALLLVVVGCLSFGWFALLADEYEQLGKHVAGGAGFVSNLVLWSESGYFDNVSETKPLLHLWSLGVEEQFYLFWPLLVWAAYKLRFNLLFVACVVAGISFALNLAQYREVPVQAFYSPLTRFWELLAGSILAYCVYSHPVDGGQRNEAGFARKVWQRIGSTGWSVVGAVLIIFAVVRMSAGQPFPGYWALLPVLGAVLVIAAGKDAWFNRVVLSNRLLVWFGLISYPLYLWHWPLLSFARIVQSQDPGRMARVAAVVAAIVLAWLTYRLVEQPVRRNVVSKTIPAVLLLLMALTGLTGFSVYHLDGVPSRSAAREFKNNKSELVRLPAMDDRCKAYVGSEDTIFPYCRFHDAGGPTTVAVIGDSHAHVAFPGIAEHLSGAAINTVLLANSGCPPFIGAEYGNTESAKAQCKAQIEKIVGEVAEKPDIRHVFIFSRGALYVSGQGYGEIERHRTDVPHIPGQVFKEGLQRTISRLRAAGKTVYYVNENPEVGVDPAVCVDRPFRLNVRDCSVPLDEVLERQREYLDVTASLQDVELISPLSAFCPLGRCQAVASDGALLYADGDHLSVSGSRFQAQEVLGDLLARIASQAEPAE